jgi:RecJ-like exonuclease
MSENISELIKTATEIVLSYPKSTRIRVISHYDADGISAAGILCTALYREGYDFHATCMRNPFNKGFERLAKEKNDLIIFSDMGSAQIETIEKINSKSIIFDHHQYLKKVQSENLIQINANLCGIDGNYEACGATLCYSFAHMLNENNSDLVSFALTGAIGDKQHIGGIKGFNEKILNQALKDGFIKEKTRIKLHGNSLFDALFFSIDPYYPGLSGNKDEVEKLFTKFKIDKNATITDINSNILIKLQSYLLFRLISARCQQNILDIVIRKRYFSEKLGCELERFADLLDACGKFGFRGTGLSLCFNNKNIFSEAEENEKKYKQKILQFLMELEHGKIQEKNAMRYFYSENTSLGGVVAGIAANYIFDEKKPLFSLARKKDEIHISCRGNQKLVSKGLDLGGALKQVSSEIGGFGGGHKIAAGATIALDKEVEFLQKVDQILTSQIG